MRAFTIAEFEANAGGLRRCERPVPTPSRNDVLIRIHARALNFRDKLILNNAYPIRATQGIIPMSDGAGEVVAIGDGVSRVRIGDRVVCCYFPRWIGGGINGMPSWELASEQFGCTRDGMLADVVVADEESVVRTPAHLSFEEAATLPCAGVTAWSSLTGPRPMLPGETVLTIGSGGVALFAVAFAKVFGARVISVTSSEAKIERLKRLGADDVVSTETDPQWDVTVRKLTSGHGVDHIVETGGTSTFLRSIGSAAPGGAIASVAAFAEGTFEAQVFRAPVVIRRVLVGSRTQLEQMIRAIDYHKVRPVIERVFGFDEAIEAYRFFEDRKHFGKIVISDDPCSVASIH